MFDRDVATNPRAYRSMAEAFNDADRANWIEGYKRPPSWLWVAVYVAAGVVLAVVL